MSFLRGFIDMFDELMSYFTQFSEFIKNLFYSSDDASIAASSDTTVVLYDDAHNNTAEKSYRAGILKRGELQGSMGFFSQSSSEPTKNNESEVSDLYGSPDEVNQACIYGKGSR